jgi:hypothetical protein
LSEFIGEVDLRNCHRVYREGADYRVDQVNESREQVVYSYTIPAEAVKYLCSQLKGRRVTKKEGAAVLKPVANRFNLPFNDDWKLDYYAQEVLVVLVALGQAWVNKEGRGYFYTIWRC